MLGVPSEEPCAQNSPFPRPWVSLLYLNLSLSGSPSCYPTTIFPVECSTLPPEVSLTLCNDPISDLLPIIHPSQLVSPPTATHRQGEFLGQGHVLCFVSPEPGIQQVPDMVEEAMNHSTNQWVLTYFPTFTIYYPFPNLPLGPEWARKGVERALGIPRLRTSAIACNTHLSSTPSLPATPWPLSSLRTQTLQRLKRYHPSWDPHAWTRVADTGYLPQQRPPTLSHATHCPGHFCSSWHLTPLSPLHAEPSCSLPTALQSLAQQSLEETARTAGSGAGAEPGGGPS